MVLSEGAYNRIVKEAIGLMGCAELELLKGLIVLHSNLIESV